MKKRILPLLLALLLIGSLTTAFAADSSTVAGVFDVRTLASGYTLTVTTLYDKTAGGYRFFDVTVYSFLGSDSNEEWRASGASPYLQTTTPMSCSLRADTAMKWSWKPTGAPDHTVSASSSRF